MRSVYAFCRVVDDIADGPMPAEQKRTMLADWRAEIDRLYDGRPRSAIGRRSPARSSAMTCRKGEFLMMIEGMEMDANGPIVAPPLRELSRYNRRVAGCGRTPLHAHLRRLARRPLAPLRARAGRRAAVDQHPARRRRRCRDRADLSAPRGPRARRRCPRLRHHRGRSGPARSPRRASASSPAPPSSGRAVPFLATRAFVSPPRSPCSGSTRAISTEWRR